MCVSSHSGSLSDRRVSMHKGLFVGSSCLTVVAIRIVTLFRIHAVADNVMVRHIEMMC